MRLSLLFLLAFVISFSHAEISCQSNGGKSGDFDFYVLAQSWSGTFCLTHQDYIGCQQPTIINNSILVFMVYGLTTTLHAEGLIIQNVVLIHLMVNI